MLETSPQALSNYRHILLMASFDYEDYADEAELLEQVKQAVQLGADMIDIIHAHHELLDFIELSLMSVQPRDLNQIYPTQFKQSHISNKEKLAIHTLPTHQELGAKIAFITQLSQKTTLEQASAILLVSDIHDIETAWSCIKTLDALKRTP